MLGIFFARRSAPVLALLGGVLACAPLRKGGVDPAAATPPGEATLEGANRRWQGARCHLALPLEVGRSAGEWTGSGSIYVKKAEGGGSEFYYQFLVERRAELGAVFDGDTLRQDTPFVAEGWRLKDAEAGKGPYLELRIGELPVRARVEFRGVRQFDFDGFPLSRLSEIEDYCRRTLFRVAAEAPQTSVPSPARPVGSPSTTPLPPAAPPAPGPRPAAPRPTLEVVRVAVNPASVARGGDAELLAVYTVAGLSPGGSVEVLERREVLKGELLILSTEDRHERPAATFTSAKPLRFSLDAAPGAYLLRVTLEGGGARAEATARFELR